MKAYELLDSPEKWFGAGYEPEPDTDRVCALIAINRAYKCPEPIEANLKRALGVDSIIDWNDSHDWRTVYETLKGLDI
jgi:hypothetical protein